MAIKTYVQVEYEIDESGMITPLCLVFHKWTYPIDKVLEARQAIAVNAGGNGLRYTVRIAQRKTYLFLDDSNRWFVEEKVPHEIARVGGIIHEDMSRF